MHSSLSGHGHRALTNFVGSEEMKAESHAGNSVLMFRAVLFTRAEDGSRGGTQVSIMRRMDKQNMTQPYKGVLFSLEEEGISDTSYNMDEP